MDDKTLCPLCGEGHVTPRTEATVTEYHGQKGTVTLRYTECDVCGSEITGDADGRFNKRAVLRFRKQVDGLLTGTEIRAIREQYGLTQAQAAKLFGGGPVAFSKYENDDVSHSESMDSLLRLIRHSEEAFWGLVKVKQMTELLHRRRVHRAHFEFTSEIFLTTKLNVEEPLSHRTKRTSYITEPRSVELTQPWMQ